MSGSPATPRRTASGLVRETVYGPADAAHAEVGEPGQYPFTRGLHPSGYRGRLWTMRQYAGFGSARDSNRRYRYLLERGTTGLSVAFDLPTQIGYDSDDPHSVGEVGRVGVAIDSLEDMEALLEGIPLEKVSTSMTINATAAILLALYVAVARRRGIAESALSGTVQNDILKEYVARGTYIHPPGPSLRLVTDVLAYGEANAPEVEHHLDLGLPHPRGGGDRAPGARLHLRERHRVRARGPGGGPRPRRASASGSASSSPATRTSSRRSRSSGPRGGSGPAS